MCFDTSLFLFSGTQVRRHTAGYCIFFPFML